MSKPKWTRAGVRHKEPKWYWVRIDGRIPHAWPAQVWRDEAGGTWWANPSSQWGSQPWPPDIERWSEPIKEPQ